MTISEKYLSGPNSSPSRVIGTPSAAITMVATVPAMNDPTAARPKARPAWPRLAISCPSMAVTTAVASSGMLTRMAVVDPPYWAP